MSAVSEETFKNSIQELTETIQGEFKVLNSKVHDLDLRVNGLEAKVNDLQSQKDTNIPCGHGSDWPSGNPEQENMHYNAQTLRPHSQLASQDISGIKASFTAIQDSVSWITLDSVLKLKYSAQGIIGAESYI